MSKTQIMRGFINQKLSAAAEEIFELFERTIAEYEEQLCRAKEENQRHKKLLDAVCNPQLRLHRTEIQQLVVGEELLPKHQECGTSPQQHDSELPVFKEEQEKLWMSQDRQQLQGLDEENPQSSLLHQKQNVELRGTVEGPGPVRYSDPDTEVNNRDSAESKTEMMNAHQQMEEEHLDLILSEKGIKRRKKIVKMYECLQCGKMFNQNSNLKTHMILHTGEKPFSCQFCGKGFALRSHLQGHERCHTGEKPYSCSQCKKSFSRLDHLQSHMRTHTGEKPYACNSCNNRFKWHSQLKKHTCGGGS